jgi:hypothetical protein
MEQEMSNSATNQIEWIVKPKVLDQENYKAWFQNPGRPDRKAVCEICGEKLVMGKQFACTFSNFGGNIGGNPITGECCFDIPFQERLAIWNYQWYVKDNVAKIAFEAYKEGKVPTNVERN